mmetsp:Transcript_28807/g.97105  ORF Transcript_28807/g.97105 Transcript_28807/m.97105 type:complete len:220 (-) Transcript_28807:967-1626(-)
MWTAMPLLRAALSAAASRQKDRVPSASTAPVTSMRPSFGAAPRMTAKALLYGAGRLTCAFFASATSATAAANVIAPCDGSSEPRRSSVSRPLKAASWRKWSGWMVQWRQLRTQTSGATRARPATNSSVHFTSKRWISRSRRALPATRPSTCSAACRKPSPCVAPAAGRRRTDSTVTKDVISAFENVRCTVPSSPTRQSKSAGHGGTACTSSVGGSTGAA